MAVNADFLGADWSVISEMLNFVAHIYGKKEYAK
jgi:hypothetical protein